MSAHLHSTLYTREKNFGAAAAAAAAALPARAHPRHLCSISSPTVPRAAFRNIWVFVDTQRLEHVSKTNGWRNPRHVDVKCMRELG